MSTINSNTPEFATLTRNSDCCSLGQVITHCDSLRRDFGIVKPQERITPEVLDLCVQNVRLVSVHDVDFTIPAVGIDQMFDHCCLTGPTTGALDTSFSRLMVTGIEEKLVDCESPTPLIHIKVWGQVVLKFVQHAKPSPLTHYVAIPVNILDDYCGTAEHPYKTFPCGHEVSNCLANPCDAASPLKLALRQIDGSCTSVNLCCDILGDSGCIQIQGKIVNKLWKEESVYITGLRPYEIADDENDFELTSLTIKSVFTNQYNHSCKQACPR